MTDDHSSSDEPPPREGLASPSPAAFRPLAPTFQCPHIAACPISATARRRTMTGIALVAMRKVNRNGSSIDAVNARYSVAVKPQVAA